MNTKIGFIIGVLLLAFIGVFIFKNSPASKTTSGPSVLGISTDTNKITKETQKIGQSFLDTSAKIVGAQASQAAQLVSETVIKAAMDPIVDHINQLPAPQKEEVIKAICK
jgi:hypothetical protein